MTEVIYNALQSMDGQIGDIWVVGGSVRDWALGRPSKDLDVAVDGDVAAAGHAIAQAAHGHFFVMHPASQTARVALPGNEWVDLVPLPNGLIHDLHRRDFTINAMAMPLASFLEVHAGPGPLALLRDELPHGMVDLPHGMVDPPHGIVDLPPGMVDPTHGWEDLRDGVLRMTHPESFIEDPLRTLRGLRLEAALSRPGSGYTGYVMEPHTERSLRAAIPRLSAVSAERVRDEWLLTLGIRRAADAVVRAADLGLLDVIVPEWREMVGVSQNLYHHLDVWEHTLDVMRQFDLMQDIEACEAPLCVPEDLRGMLEGYLAEYVTPPHSRRALMHLAILLHDIGKPATRTEGEDGRIRFLGHERTSEEVARLWALDYRLSGRERQFVLATVGLHMRPGALVGEGVTLRAIHRFFRDAASAAPALLLLNAADRLAAQGPWTTDEEVIAQVVGSWRLLRMWFDMRNTVALPLPVSGRDLMAAFNIEPGPRVGRLIQALRDIHAETPFHDRDTALEAAAEILPTQDTLNIRTAPEPLTATDA